VHIEMLIEMMVNDAGFIIKYCGERVGQPNMIQNLSIRHLKLYGCFLRMWSSFSYLEIPLPN